MLRVLHIVSGDLWGGAESQVYSLLKAARQTAVLDIMVVTFNHGLLEEKLKAAGLAVIVIDEADLSVVRQILRLTKVVREFKPRIIHSHRFKENIFAAAASIFCGCSRCVCTVHGAAEHQFGFWQFRKRAIRLLERAVLLLFFRRIVAVSVELQGKLSAHFPVRKLETIANGIDIAAVHSESQTDCPVPGGRDTTKVAFVGRLAPVKRVDLFVALAAVLERRRPGRFEFYVFGEGSQSDSLQGMVAHQELGRCFHIMGFKDNIGACLKQMDCLVVCSDHEGLPMNVLEALVLNVFIVSHAVGGIPEVIDRAGGGALIRSQEPEQYADVIERLAVGRRREKNDQVPDAVSRYYSAQATCQHYIALYRALASESNR